MPDKKWKSHLLSSSLPLEYEVARILVKKGFAVDADYTYSRDDESGQSKDFSVDIRATGWPPFTDPDTLHGVLELLVECKHRVRGTKWLFLPDVNKLQLSNIYLGAALKVFDEFSTFHVDRTPSNEFTDKTSCCYKGVEVQQAGGVYDSEIRHGIEQLRYGLPRLLSNAILNNIMGHPEDNMPFLICPILLTTAELLVLKKNLTIAAVEATDELAEIGKPVPWLITHSGYGPGFESHCEQSCRVLANYADRSRVQRVGDIREAASSGSYPGPNPRAFMKALAKADSWELGSCFTQRVYGKWQGDKTGT